MVDIDIEKIDIHSLVPADYNPRKISDKDYKNLKNSIDEFGIVDPIIINLKDNTIIGGHQRFDVLFYENESSEMNLIRLGDIGWVFPDTNLKIIDKNHEKALNLALNRVHGEWDEDLLNNVLIELEELNLDHLTGFDLELDDISYDFISRIDEEYDETESEEYNEWEEYDDEDEIENTDNEIIEEFESEEEKSDNIIDNDSDNINNNIIRRENSSDTKRIRRGFIKYGDIYKVGDSSYLMFGKETNEQDRTKLFNVDDNNSLIDIPNEIKKIKTINKEINFYMCDDAELIEKFILKNNGNCKKLK